MEVCCDACLTYLEPSCEIRVWVTSTSQEETEDSEETKDANDFNFSLLTGSTMLSEDASLQTPFVKCLAGKLREVANQAAFDLNDPEIADPEDELLKMVVLWPMPVEVDVLSSQADLDLADSVVTGFAATYSKRITEVVEHCAHLSIWSRKEIKRRYNLGSLDPTLFPHNHGHKTKPGFERMYLSGEQKDQILDDYESERLDIHMIRNKFCVSEKRFYKWRKARRQGKRMKDFALEELVSFPMKAAWQELFAEMQIDDKRRLN
jgi:transposase-like protein